MTFYQTDTSKSRTDIEQIVNDNKTIGIIVHSCEFTDIASKYKEVGKNLPTLIKVLVDAKESS